MPSRRNPHGTLDPDVDELVQRIQGDHEPSNLLVRDGHVTGIPDWEFTRSGSTCADIGDRHPYLGPDFDNPAARRVRSNRVRHPLDWRQRAALIDLTSHLEFLTSPMSNGPRTPCANRIVYVPDS
jgi:hypothetical protein